MYLGVRGGGDGCCWVGWGFCCYWCFVLYGVVCCCGGVVCVGGGGIWVGLLCLGGVLVEDVCMMC